MSEHCASKHAFVGLTEALRGEFERFGIDVLLVLPGLVRSDDLEKHLLRNEGKIHLDFAGAQPADEVADSVVRSLLKNRMEAAVGFASWWVWFGKRMFPRGVRFFMQRKVWKYANRDGKRNWCEPCGKSRDTHCGSAPRRDARDIKGVLDAGIEAIVDLAKMCEPVQPTRELVYLRFPLEDGADNPPWQITAAVHTVVGLLRLGVPTLVACEGGMSRSLVIAAAALWFDTPLQTSLDEVLIKLAADSPVRSASAALGRCEAFHIRG